MLFIVALLRLEFINFIINKMQKYRKNVVFNIILYYLFNICVFGKIWNIEKIVIKRFS